MRVTAIIQARMGSTRLPGKSMKLLAGKPLVQHVIERIKLSNELDEIILAIPNTSENMILNELGSSLGIIVFKGSEENLVDRYYKAALITGCDYVVRIPADNPVPQSSEIDRIIQHHLSLGRRGFSSNLAEIFGSGYPDGIGAEIFDFSLLKEISKMNLSRKLQEHVHLNFFDYSTQKVFKPEWCPVSTIKCPIEFARPELVLDVNTHEQYLFMVELFEANYRKNPKFDIKDIIYWYDNEYNSRFKEEKLNEQ